MANEEKKEDLPLQIKTMSEHLISEGGNLLSRKLAIFFAINAHKTGFFVNHIAYSTVNVAIETRMPQIEYSCIIIYQFME